MNKKHHLNCHFTSDELQIAIKNQSITTLFGLDEQDKCSDDWGHSASAGGGDHLKMINLKSRAFDICGKDCHAAV